MLPVPEDKKYPPLHEKYSTFTVLKQTIEKSICKDCGGGKILIRLKIQS